GGVGKTALAVRAAHRLAPRFPDGQLFLDLYGFTQGTAPREPGDALAALLSALGVPPQQIPAELGARAAFYRDRLADTRTLIVLDNAVDEAQVTPLLPACATCLVLVTSRKRLKALDDALPLPLDVLPPGEAVTLLRRAARLGEEPGNEALLEQAAALCGRLPLALLIAGALVRTGGEAWNLSVLIERLTVRRPGQELAGFTDGTRSVPAVFELSYQQLSGDLQRLFRLIGLLPGPELDAYAAAALLDSDPGTADGLLQRLADHSLLTGVSRGRYRPHDLIRAHARTLATALDPEPEREAALDRLLHYYAHTAQRASQPIARFPRPAPVSPAPAFAPTFADPDAAHAWLRIEHPDLDAAFTHAHTHGLVGHAIALGAGLAEILLTDGPWTRAFEVHQAAADSAENAGHPADHANALTDLGRVRYTTGDYAGADDALASALESYRVHEDALGQANSLTELGRVRYVTGDYSAADDALTRALEIFRVLDNPLGQANALAELGRVRHVSGDYPAADEALTRALEIFRVLGNRLGQANALNNLGQVRSLGGDYPGAGDALTGALEIFRVIGNRLGEATALNGLGRARMSTGDYPGAGEAFIEALEICRAIGFQLGEAYVLSEAGRLRERTQDYAGADEAHTGALEIFRTVGDRLGEANALTDLGSVRSAIGDNPGASETLVHALEIYREIGDQGNEAWALNHYAAAVAASGDRPRALDLYQQALAMNRELSKPDDEAVSLEGIAEHYSATGDTVQGATYLNQALEIYSRLGMRADIERVQARVDESTGSAAT
ncbi:tetratricopeptide repeat protein, partial [Actinospica durhamensis]